MIKTDFSEVKDLFLVYPEGFDKVHSQLTGFYKKLLGVIPQEIHLFIIVNNEKAGIKIKSHYPNKNIDIIPIPNFNEIWLRDIMGFNTGENRIYKPIYSPDYCKYIYTAGYLEIVNRQLKEIIEKSTKAEIIELPIVLDGGNLITNGEIGFITDKIYNDNKELGKNVKSIIRNYLGIEPIIIKSNKNDKLSHTDGYMAFLNKKKICISQYPEIAFLKDDNKYLEAIRQETAKHSLETIKIYDRPVAEKVIGGGNAENDKSKDCLSSARGIYINFLRLNDTIILPEYSIPGYKKAIEYNTINKQALTNLGYKVITINCDEIARLGGSLRCITFTN